MTTILGSKKKHEDEKLRGDEIRGLTTKPDETAKPPEAPAPPAPPAPPEAPAPVEEPKRPEERENPTTLARQWKSTRARIDEIEAEARTLRERESDLLGRIVKSTGKKGPFTLAGITFSIAETEAKDGKPGRYSPRVERMRTPHSLDDEAKG